MIQDWNELSRETQYTLAHAALQEAVELLAEQAEIFAGKIEAGVIIDQGSSEALRTFAKLARFQAWSERLE